MTIILFLVDTSASMNQRTYLGTTLIDVAKAAVETFMKVTKTCEFIFVGQYFGRSRTSEKYLHIEFNVSRCFFIQIRARDPNSRWDRYMLLTFEDPPANVKVNKTNAVQSAARSSPFQFYPTCWLLAEQNAPVNTFGYREMNIFRGGRYLRLSPAIFFPGLTRNCGKGKKI